MPPPPHEGIGDQTLVAWMNEGDESAFEALYYRYRDWVAGLAFRVCGDRELALDVLQETFFYFLKKFPGFELRAQMKTFLYPVVRNLAIAARRKGGRFESGEDAEERLEQTPAPAAEPAAGERLELALASLSEEHRETLWLRFVDGLSLAEVATAMGVPLGTVKSRLHYALDLLRRDERTRGLFDE